MRPFSRISILLAVLLVAGLGAPPATADSDFRRVAEPVLGFMIDDTGVWFQVESNGCTTKADFVVKVTWTQPRHLDLIRVRPDPCDGVIPYGTRVYFTWEEMGLRLGARWEIGNRLRNHLAAPLDFDASDAETLGFAPDELPRAECIRGVWIQPEGITYRVDSDFCTEPGDFRVSRSSTTPSYLLLIRKNKGTCAHAGLLPTTVDLTFSWKQLGLRPGERFEFGNHLEREGFCRLYGF